MRKHLHELVTKLHGRLARADRSGNGLGPLRPVSAGLGRLKARFDAAELELQRYRNKELLRAMHAKVLSTPARRCHPQAKVEVHTLTAHHHLLMYLTAIKSLLRFHDDVAVVVHDDGSLDAHDASLLESHVEGVRLIRRASADAEMESQLSGRPASAGLRRKIVNALELFDNIVLARTERLVNLNSDVLFLGEPVELSRWLAGESRTVAGVFEETPAKQKDFLLRFGCPFPPHVTTALACIPRDIFDAAFVEEILEKTECDWFTAQNVYPLLYHRFVERYPVHFFPQDRYQSSGVFPEGAAFRHYWTSTGWFTELQTRDSERVTNELGNL